MQPIEIIFIVFIVLAAVFAGLYFLNRWAARRMTDQQSLIDKNRTVVSIYVIDKKRDKITNVKMPKAAVDAMPKTARFMNMYFAQAKVGAQITTLICDKKVYNQLPVKRNVKVGLAGIYITDVPGAKSEEQIKKEQKEKKKQAKEAAAKEKAKKSK